MSAKAWKKARRAARRISAEFDAAWRAVRKLPRWRRFMARLGYRGFVDRWVDRWEIKHKRSLEKATKQTTRFLGGAKYHMVPVKKQEVKNG
jgi:hypothetical protein